MIYFFFSNECDEIRPALRNQLLIDSKLCQLEQIKDQKLLNKKCKDMDETWHLLMCRDFENKTLKEKAQFESRVIEGKSVQNILKQQMIDKMERERIHEEINDWNKQFAKDIQKDNEDEIKKIRNEFKRRETLKGDILKQIHESRELKKQQLVQEMKNDKIICEEIHNDLKKLEETRRNESAHFKREVRHYLDYLQVCKNQNMTEEHEKEKLNDDIRRLKCDLDWIKRCDFHNKRAAVNREARSLQVWQIKEQQKQKYQESILEREYNKAFNEKEIKERNLLREEKWQQRLKNFRYGQELLEQAKQEQLRRLAEKQKLEEEIKLIEQERLRWEERGKEFVKSFQDILPLHSNLQVVLKGKKYNI